MKREAQPRVIKSANAPVARRRAWRRPRLVEYGPVAKLTQSGVGSVHDGAAMGPLNMRVCL